MTRGKVLKLLCTKLNIKRPLPHLKAPDVSGCSGSLLVVKWGSGGRASEPLADCWWFAGSPAQHTSSFHGEKVRLDSQRQQNSPYPLLTVRGPFRRLHPGSRSKRELSEERWGWGRPHHHRFPSHSYCTGNFCSASPGPGCPLRASAVCRFSDAGRWRQWGCAHAAF